MKKFRALALLAFAGALTIAAFAQESAPPTITEDPDGQRFLFIPGIGRIPLPPGSRSFSPSLPAEPEEGVASRALGPRARPPAPEPPLSPEAQQARDLNRLFARLANAEDEREAQGAAAAILRRWAQSGSDTIDLLTARALVAETAGAPALAKALLDYVVALSPRWPEAFVRRARVAASEGDYAGALADLETAARLEPRRFDALAALGALAEKTGNKKRALDAYRKALDISPKDAALQRDEERLRLDVEGRGI
jgi:tetratricopeptide (TPR) repeat protein